ncbi:hypothetical protein WJX75_009990 [Coccomyxa subellipsoidea]|uniref:Uncharacterized protein n=1 Tax=Coccomyxa subellipsoidea TaxID=248742 RepID=A0ABR2YJ01_9CHLO
MCAALRSWWPAYFMAAVFIAYESTTPADLAQLNSLGDRKLLDVQAAAPGGLTLEFNVDRNAIAANITDRITKEAQVTREAFFKNLVSTIYYFLNGSYNVLAANIGQDYTWQNQQGTILYAFGIYNEVPFGVWAFTSGNFVNKGSDDPSNWAFLGRYTVNGTTISFKQSGD